MASDLNPGALADLFLRLAEQARDRGRLALEPLAIAIENQAKTNVSSGSHRYGTKTPARPGSGPAIITGSLRRAITHVPVVATPAGWTTAVGIAGGIYPPRPPNAGKRGGKGRQTPVSKYASYLEIRLKNGTNYPFLKPAFQFGVTVAAPTIYRSIFAAPWGQTA